VFVANCAMTHSTPPHTLTRTFREQLRTECHSTHTHTLSFAHTHTQRERDTHTQTHTQVSRASEHRLPQSGPHASKISEEREKKETS
jgi:hypothetical protein